ncbi:MAG: hypothetical protein U0871_04100 [Gemmataceae bacterium]
MDSPKNDGPECLWVVRPSASIAIKMTPKSDAEWRSCNNATELFRAAGATVNTETAHLIYASAIGLLWTYLPASSGASEWAMHRLEMRRYERSSLSNDQFVNTLQIGISLLDETISTHSSQAAELAQDGDWYGSWLEQNSAKILRQAHKGTLELCAKLLRQNDLSILTSEQFATTFCTEAAAIALTRPDRPPLQLCPMPPWELPWEWYIRLENKQRGIPSIWNNAVASFNNILCDTIRDILISPFVTVDFPVEWQSERIHDLCNDMRSRRCFDRMEELSDTLQDLGCADTDVLLHCTHSNHYRSCWLLDNLTGHSQI